MKRVFVTGSTGFIGQRLIAALLEKGIEVFALALPEETDKLLHNELLHPVVGNLERIEEIEKQLEGKKFDTTYHLAWIGVSTTYKNDVDIQMKNISYALKVMELASGHSCRRVICTGSVSEYAYAEGAVNGQQIPSPCDMYSATKSAVHIYCDLFARQNDMYFNWVLIPSIYGPGRNDNNLITYAIKMLLNDSRPSFTKLEQRWDYIYISDLICSLILVGERGKGSKVYVTGSGNARPMYEYVEILKNQIDPDAELGIGDLPYKTSRIDNAVVDITVLAEDTGYKPLVPFEEGIKATINYFKTLGS